MKSLAWVAVGLSVCGALAACASDEGGPSGGSGGGTSGGFGGSTTGGTGGSSASGGSGGSTTGGGTGGVAGSADSGTGGAGGGLPEGGPPVAVTGVVTEFNPTNTGAPVLVAGAQVCIKDSTLCATSDSAGVYFIPAVPSGIESALLVTKTNYMNTAVVGVVATTDMTIDVLFPPTSIAQIFALAAGFTWPLDQNGVMLAQAFETVNTDAGALLDPVAGATFTITPSTGIVGPVYVSDQNFPEPAATSTSIQGWGGFGDAAVGEYTIKVAKPGRNCVRGQLGWPSANPDEARVPAIAGYIAQVIPFTCDP
jgi:hypothetical protein